MTAKHCKILLVKRPSKTRTRKVIFRPRELNTLKYDKWNLTKRKALKVPEKKKGNWTYFYFQNVSAHTNKTGNNWLFYASKLSQQLGLDEKIIANWMKVIFPEKYVWNSLDFKLFSGGHTPKASLAAHVLSATADLASLMWKVWLRPCNLATWKPVSLSIPRCVKFWRGFWTFRNFQLPSDRDGTESVRTTCWAEKPIESLIFYRKWKGQTFARKCHSDQSFVIIF